MASDPTTVKDFAKVEIVNKQDSQSIIRNGQEMKAVDAGHGSYATNEILLTEQDFATLRKRELIHVIMQDGQQVWLRYMVS